MAVSETMSIRTNVFGFSLARPADWQPKPVGAEGKAAHVAKNVLILANFRGFHARHGSHGGGQALEMQALLAEWSNGKSRNAAYREFPVGGARVVRRNGGGDNVTTARTAKMAVDASNPIES
jgi:hypothetical protein